MGGELLAAPGIGVPLVLWKLETTRARRIDVSIIRRQDDPLLPLPEGPTIYHEMRRISLGAS